MIIGISGHKQSGKDTVAKIIQYLTAYPNSNGFTDGSRKNRSYNSYIMDRSMGGDIISSWETKKFANKLKDIICLLIGCTREQLEDNDFKERELEEEWQVELKSGFFKENGSFGKSKKTVRWLLQTMGTECGRQIIHPDIWVNALMSEYKGRIIRGYQGSQKIDINTYPNWIITDVRFPNEVQAIKDKGGIIIRVNRPNIVSTDIHESETALDNYKGWDAIIINNSSIESLIEIVKVYLQKLNIIK